MVNCITNLTECNKQLTVLFCSDIIVFQKRYVINRIMQLSGIHYTCNLLFDLDIIKIGSYHGENGCHKNQKSTKRFHPHTDSSANVLHKIISAYFSTEQNNQERQQMSQNLIYMPSQSPRLLLIRHPIRSTEVTDYQSQGMKVFSFHIEI